MKSQKDNQEIFEEALALREAMRQLIHSQVTNQSNESNENDKDFITERKEKKREKNTSA